MKMLQQESNMEDGSSFKKDSEEVELDQDCMEMAAKGAKKEHEVGGVEEKPLEMEEVIRAIEDPLSS
jgi:hypothetical protein